MKMRPGLASWKRVGRRLSHWEDPGCPAQKLRAMVFAAGSGGWISLLGTPPPCTSEWFGLPPGGGGTSLLPTSAMVWPNCHRRPGPSPASRPPSVVRPGPHPLLSSVAAPSTPPCCSPMGRLACVYNGHPAAPGHMRNYGLREVKTSMVGTSLTAPPPPLHLFKNPRSLCTHFLVATSPDSLAPRMRVAGLPRALSPFCPPQDLEKAMLRGQELGARLERLQDELEQATLERQEFLQQQACQHQRWVGGP